MSVLDYDYFEIRDIYRTKFTKSVCKNCGDRANSFVNYWGKKKESDLLALNYFLRSG